MSKKKCNFANSNTNIQLNTCMNYSLLFAVFSTLAVTTAFAQTEVKGNEWNLPEITNVNKEAAHTVSIPVGSETDIAENNIANSPYYQSLDGKWKFFWVGKPENANATWCAADYNDTNWTEIDVPSSWQVWGVNHGKTSWDKPLYCNVRYPFEFDRQTFSVMAPRPGWYSYSQNTNPVGTYRRTFTIPSTWKGREIYVRFNGVGHGYYLWVNGKRIGYSEDSYLPSEFNITDFLVEGTNSIALQVYRFTSGSFLECQDYWRLTGIQRHCFLWAAPKSQIRDYFFTTDLNDSFTAAKANVNLTLTNIQTGSRVEAKIMDGQQEIARAESEVKGSLSLDMNVSNPRLWSAETPNLYDLVITLKDAEGKTIDIRGSKVGFREVGIRSDGALTINGQRMVFHGVNRHDFSPVNGRAITDAEIEQDIKTMKRLNINAVRTSHYPNDPIFYDLCDKYGLYVLAEANVECHAYQQLSSISLFKKAMVERSQNHVKWMRNHACIFMWSFGNESGGGNNFQAVASAIKALDKTRLTHYEGNSDYADVSSTMYASYDNINWIGSSRQGQKGQKPHIQCENSHSMGNSMGNVRDMFDLYEKYPCLTGEFIWDFKDQGLLTKANGKEYWAYGGDFGDNPNDGNFCINGLVHPDWTLTAKSYNTKKIYQPIEFKAVDGKTNAFLIKNKMAFLPSTTYDLCYEVMDEEGHTLAGGTINQEVKAGGTATVTLDLSALQALKGDQEAFIKFTATQKEATAWAETGYVVAEEKLPVQQAKKPMMDLTNLEKAEALKIDETPTDITLSNTDFEAVFSKTSGTLTKYTYKGVPMITSPLRLSVFRLPTDNDGRQSGSWDNMGLRQLTVKGTGTEIVPQKGNKTVAVNMNSTYTGKNGTMFDVTMGFHVCSDGAIMVNALINPSNEGTIIPKMGFRTEMPKEMEQLAWFGRGPWDSYRDRKEACLPAIYQSTVKEQYEEYILPQEHGTKQEVRWLSLRNDKGEGLLFAAPDQMAASAVHFRPEANYSNRDNRSRHTYQFKTCEQTIVNLDATTRGLGNASCGPDVMEKYELKASKTLFRFFIMPLTKDIQAAEAARIDMPVCQPVTCERQQNGQIRLSTPTQGATIYYNIDGGEYKKYATTITHPEACTVRTYCTASGRLQSVTTSSSLPFFVNKSKWKLVSADSQQGGNEARLAFDGNLSTFWHTKWGAQETACPHTIVIDMVNTYNISALLYQGRQDGNQNGMIKGYEVYLSVDNKTWKKVAIGEFKATTSQQVAKFSAPTEGRYLKLTAKSEVNGRAWSSAAEIGIEATELVTDITPATAAAKVNPITYSLQGYKMGPHNRQVGKTSILIKNGKKILM
jgi:beta-galactosidase